MKKTQTNRPTPPDDLDGEALLEWHRVVAELDALGTLDAASRAVLTLYTRTWAVWNAAARVVAVDGPVVLLPNNWPGQSAESKVMDSAGKQLAKLLDVLGLTPAKKTATPDTVTSNADDDLDA